MAIFSKRYINIRFENRPELTAADVNILIASDFEFFRTGAGRFRFFAPWVYFRFFSEEEAAAYAKYRDENSANSENPPGVGSTVGISGNDASAERGSLNTLLDGVINPLPDAKSANPRCDSGTVGPIPSDASQKSGSGNSGESRPPVFLQPSKIHVSPLRAPFLDRLTRLARRSSYFMIEFGV